MLTTIARLMPTARRLLGRNAWNKHAALTAAVSTATVLTATVLTAIVLSPALGAAAAAADDSAGVIRVSDQQPAPAPGVADEPGGGPFAPTTAPGPQAFGPSAPFPVSGSPGVSLPPGAVVGADPSDPGNCPPEGSGYHCCLLGHCCLCHCCLSHCCLCGGSQKACQDGTSRGLLGRCLTQYCPLHCCGDCGWRFLDAHVYCMTYPVNPWYCDSRDGRVYAAYGYGAPMSVPLAPTVTNQYNYGWGVPSGRLTPISRVAPHPGALTAAVAPR